MQHYTNSVIAFNGDRVANATITVTDLFGNAVTIYQDFAGTTPLASTTTNNNGEFDFYIPAGRYNITASGVGISGYTINDEFIGIADSSVSPFTQSGTGAVTRTAQNKMRESVSVKDFGAVGDGVTDDTAAFNKLFAYANTQTNGIEIKIPAGIYVFTSQPTTINKSVILTGDGQISTRLLFKNCGGVKFDLSATGVNAEFNSCGINNLSVLTDSTGYVGISFKGDHLGSPHQESLGIRNVNVTSNLSYAAIPTSAEWSTGIYIEYSDQVTIENSHIQGSILNQSYAVSATSKGIVFNSCMIPKVINCNIYFVGDGVCVNGQSEGAAFSENTIVSVMRGIVFESLVAPCNNHVICNSHVSAISKGIYFQTGTDNPEACYISNIFALEFDPQSSKPTYTAFDLGFRLSSVINCTIQSNVATTPIRIGINVDANANTFNNICFYLSTTLFNVTSVPAVTQYVYAFNCVSYTSGATKVAGTTSSFISTGIYLGDANVIRSTALAYSFVDSSGNEMMQLNGTKCLLGNNTASNRFIDFKSNIGGSSVYDSRILSSGGSGATNGGGSINITSSQVVSSGPVLPSTDNSITLGAAANRWSVVYAGAGTINTSDERAKEQIESLSDAETLVAITLKGMIKKFKFKDAVAEKGDAARIHVGVVAQEVAQVFIDNGLNPNDYALFCYDEWDETLEVINDEDGTVITPYRPAGNRYGIRYEQLLAFIISAI